MATKHLSGYYADGYTLSVGYRKLIIDKTAGVGGYGVTAPFSATVVNHGAVYGSGYGVYLEAGGSLINGSAKDTGALITGGDAGVRIDGAASLANFGAIVTLASSGTGVILDAGGSLTNGSAGDTTALIQGKYGVDAFGAATVANFGTIAQSGPYGRGVILHAGGSITNGSSGDTTALISGAASGVAATVTNFGTIAGVDLAGGSLTNGSADDTTALIQAEAGVSISGATVANFATIAGEGYGAGAFIQTGGSVANGSAQDTAALITGYYGVEAYRTTSTTVVNFGTIAATGRGNYGNGVKLYESEGSSLTNGSTHDTSALIEGYRGVLVDEGGATIVNYGTIEGHNGVSVALYGSGGLVVAEAGSTFIGTINGGGGDMFLAGGGTGTISNLGDGGTLTGAVDADFYRFGLLGIETGGTWTLTGPNTLNAADILLDEGTLINSGPLNLSGRVVIDPSAVFRLANGNIVAGLTGDADIVDYGLMESTGTGQITVGAETQVSHRGVVEVAGGALDFVSRLSGNGVVKIDAGATLEADDAVVSTLTLTFNGAAATLALARPKAFHAALVGFAAGDIIDLLAIKATGASVNADDQLVVVNGTKTVATLQLSGNYDGATFTTGSDGRGGTDVTLTSGGGADRPSVAGMAAAMAALTAPAGVAALGYDLRAERGPVLARPNVHLR
jgi:fibronectin-binding autotransporter adhesin